MAREPGLSVRLRLTLSYVGFLMVAGTLLLATVWVFLLRYVPDRSGFGPGPFSPSRGDLVDAFVPRAAQALAALLVIAVVGGWFLAGRMLAPLARITDATREATKGSLSHRIRLEGRDDEFRELADSFDTMIARLEAQVAEQQRFAANASHELRTPLAITQTLLDVARRNPAHDHAELLDRLHDVNTRATGLTEALLLLSRADQRTFTRSPCRPVPAGRGRRRDPPPPGRAPRHHHRDLGRRRPHARLGRPPAAADDEPRPQRRRPQPARRRDGAGRPPRPGRTPRS